MKIKNKHIILVAILLLLVIKISALPGDIEKVEEHSESDLGRYLIISRWLSGEHMPYTGIAYQYPPLYSLMLIPALHLDTETYVLLLNVILSILTFFPLYLISRKYTGFYQGIFITSIVIIFNLVFSIKSYGYPMILSALLFSWFIYFFIDVYKDKQNYILSTVFFGLLIFTKYVFFYMLPFVIIWLYLQNDKDMQDKLKSILMFGIVPGVLFLAWCIRNILLNSSSVEGAIGGYHTLVTGNFLSIFPETIPSKLISIITHLEPNTMMLYFMFFIFGILILYLKKKEIPTFYWVLLVNFIIFFCFPAMTYDRFYLNWRYLATMTPVYLLLGLIPIFNMIKYRRTLS